MRPEEFPLLVSQEPIFNISTQADAEIQSYLSPSAGFECGH